MTDFIPFPSPNGNGKQIHPEYFEVNQKIKVKATGIVNGDSDGPATDTQEDTSSIINSHTPDLRPIYLNLYAITTDPEKWGVTAFPSWSKTPATGEIMTDPNTNGKLRFIENGGFQDAANAGIARYIISNAGGLTNFGGTWAAATGPGEAQEQQNVTGDPETGADAVKGYNCNSFSTMQAPYVRDYRNITRAIDGAVMGGNGDGTDVDDWPVDPSDPNFDDAWLPTVFTSDGKAYTPTGPDANIIGDSIQAWTQAITSLNSYASGLSDVQIIHQWDWPAVYAYSTDKTDPTAPPDYDGGYDRYSASTDFHASTGSLRWVKPNRDTGFDRGFWDYEVNGIKSLGFNGLTWGVSGNSYAEFDFTPGAAESIKAAYPDTPFLFEASPMTSTFTGADKRFHPFGTTWDGTSLSGVPDERYSVAAHWGFFPSYYTTEQYSTDADTNNWSSDGKRFIENIWWNPAIHEQHIIFDAGYLVRTTSRAPQYNFDELKDLMIFAWQHGFVVGVCSLSRSGGTTADENQAICQFVTDLNTFTTSNGIDTSSAVHPTDNGVITRYSNPAVEKAIPTQATPTGTTIGTVHAIEGERAPTVSTSEDYSITFDGSATGVTYQWEVTEPGPATGQASIANETTNNPTITFPAVPGVYTIKCTLISLAASDSPTSDELKVVVSA